MKKLLVTTAALVCASITYAHAETDHDWRHGNREKACQVLDAVLPGFADPANCQEVVALMELGPDEKALTSCLSSFSSVPNARTYRDIILVGCSMLASGIGEESARRMVQRVR